MCTEYEYVSTVEFEESYDAPAEGLGVSRSFYLLPAETYKSPRPVNELTRREIGQLGEDFAVAFLKEHGYEIRERNWRCRRGEADIVAENPEGTLTFVEVKTRRHGSTFTDCAPEEAVTQAKQDKYALLADVYLSEHHLSMPVAVDVVSIILDDDGQTRLRLMTGSIFVDR
ncbi:YraN family protein [Paratractidigestivibacter sp.]|uniref:YraN family protein n=1 Tax=Paratractidigestivibacter sp. TaxID=2847316 RepID=UPI002AC8FC17|nr:YraN family protein [Paratractidigestivibacter sp.]